MLNTVYVLLVGIFLILLTAYLIADPKKKGLTGRVYERLVLGWYKLGVTVAQGRNYVSLMLQTNFKTCHRADLHEERICIRQQRVLDFQQKMNDHLMDRRRKGFHIKITE